MKAAVISEKEKLEILDLPIPDIGDEQVLIRNKFCAICNSTDMKLYKGTHALSTYPVILGHEGAGLVESVGKKVKGIKPGDQVLAGGYPSSKDLVSMWGQYSEYGIQSEKNVIKVPDNVALEHGACAHMLCEALNAVEIGEISPGDNILIIGAGAVGFSLLTLLKHVFPNRIIIMDRIEKKLEFAKCLGADYVFNSEDPDLKEKIQEATEGKGVNKVYEAVGKQQTYHLAMDLIAHRGMLMAFGVVENNLDIPFRVPYGKEIQLRWCQAGGLEPRRNREIILNMMSKGIIDAEPLITSRVSLEDLTKGFELIESGNEIRVLVEI